MYVDRDVQDLVHVDDGREPACREEAWVGDDEERAGYFFAEVQFARADLQRMWRDDILEPQNAGAVNFFRKDGQDRRRLLCLFRKEIEESHKIGSRC